MEEIAISKFKATCLAVLERVRRTNQPIRVTRFGKPVAEIIPPSPPERPRRSFGIRQGGHIVGDIVPSSISPIGKSSKRIRKTKKLDESFTGYACLALE
jgi:prevent-host-death family protein